jgi:outer membrane usher protein
VAGAARNRAWRLAAALAVALSSPLAAQPEAQDQRAYLDLFVNQAARDSVLVRLRGAPGAEDAFVAVEDLEKAGLHGLAGSREQHDGREYVSLRSLAPALTYQLDTQNLALRVTARTALLETTTLDLRAVRRPADMVLRTDSSAFFNYSVTGTGEGAFSGAAELGMSYQGALLFSGGNVLPDGTVVRGLTNLTLDSPGSMRRVVVGDAFAQSSSVGGSALLAGASLTREFSLDPYFVRQPLPRISGAILSPSTLDVYVNGALVREQPIAPGPFEVRNLPVTGGQGQVSYVVRDAFGRTQEYASPYYSSPGVLAPGLSDYGYHLGFRRLGFGIDAFNYGPPVLVAHHRLGLSEYVTGGFRFESALEHVKGWDEPACSTCASLLASGGPTASFALPFGELDLEAAASADGHQRGAAGSIGYSLLFHGFSAAVLARGATDRYANLAYGAADDRPLLEVHGTVGAPITRRLSVALDYAQQAMRDTGLTNSITLRAEARLSQDATFLVSASRIRQPATTPEWGMTAGFIYTFGGGAMGDASGRGSSRSSGATMGVQKALPLGEGFGWQLRSNVDHEGPASGLGQVVYQGAYGTYTGLYTRTGPTDSGAMTAAGALVLVDGNVMASRPVQDGFALLQVPGLPGVRGFLNNQEVGRTDSRGNLLIPGLQPYYGNRLSIRDTDIPLDYELGKTEQVIATALRGGALVRFDVEKVRSVTGALRIDSGGQSTVPAYGEMTAFVGQRKVSSPVGAAGEFWLENVPVGTHAAEVEFGRGVCRFELKVPETKVTAVNLGTVACSSLTAVAEQ